MSNKGDNYYNHEHNNHTDNDDDDEDSSSLEEEHGAVALQIAAQANKAVINRRNVDGSYKREWRNFKKWLDDMRQTDKIHDGFFPSAA
jgi:hypothetical protein